MPDPVIAQAQWTLGEARQVLASDVQRVPHIHYRADETRRTTLDPEQLESDQHPEADQPHPEIRHFARGQRSYGDY